MKKRLTKQGRNDLARRNLKKQRRLKTKKELTVCVADARFRLKEVKLLQELRNRTTGSARSFVYRLPVSMPQAITQFNRKAAVFYLLAIMSLFIFFDHTQENRQLAVFFNNEISVGSVRADEEAEEANAAEPVLAVDKNNQKAETADQVAATAAVKVAAPMPANTAPKAIAADKVVVAGISHDVSDSSGVSPETPSELREKILDRIEGKPMEAMLDAIMGRQRAVAAFLVGIGMKESKYGTYSPKNADGEDCFNYWGYRGKENPTRSGYSCFESPEEAVRIVGDRIEELVGYGRTTPAKMIVWKCGYSCDGHSEESVRKWIADVSIDYYNLNPGKEVVRR